MPKKSAKKNKKPEAPGNPCQACGNMCQFDSIGLKALEIDPVALLCSQLNARDAKNREEKTGKDKALEDCYKWAHEYGWCKGRNDAATGGMSTRDKATGVPGFMGKKPGKEKSKKSKNGSSSSGSESDDDSDDSGTSDGSSESGSSSESDSDESDSSSKDGDGKTKFLNKNGMPAGTANLPAFGGNPYAGNPTTGYSFGHGQPDQNHVCAPFMWPASYILPCQDPKNETPIAEQIERVKTLCYQPTDGPTCRLAEGPSTNNKSGKQGQQNTVLNCSINNDFSPLCQYLKDKHSPGKLSKSKKTSSQDTNSKSFSVISPPGDHFQDKRSSQKPKCSKKQYDQNYVALNSTAQEKIRPADKNVKDKRSSEKPKSMFNRDYIVLKASVA